MSNYDIQQNKTDKEEAALKALKALYDAYYPSEYQKAKVVQGTWEVIFHLKQCSAEAKDV